MGPAVSSAAALARPMRRVAALPGLGNLVWLAVDPEFDPYKYNSFATNAGQQVHQLTRSIARRVASRSRSGELRNFPPTLVFKSEVDATVTNRAVVSNLLGHLEPNRNELVLFDINRLATKSVLQVIDPRALSDRVVGDPGLPFAVTLVSNENDDSSAIVARSQSPFSSTFDNTEPLQLNWPSSAISLSHVALPIPPDDPLYGVRPPEDAATIFLGQLAFQGERGVFALSSDWLLRIRHNPFYSYLETRALAWASQHP